MASNIQDNDIVVHKESFYREIEKNIEKSRMIYKKSDILEIISNLKSDKNNASTKDQHIYYLMKHYQGHGGVKKISEPS